MAGGKKSRNARRPGVIPEPIPIESPDNKLYKISDMLVTCWRNYSKHHTSDDGLKSFKDGLTLTRRIADGITLQSATNCDCLISSNMAWFSPINKKYYDSGVKQSIGPVIGIFVNADYNPDTVKAGKGGAGSEYAVDELANALVAQGCNVYVFTNINTDAQWKYCICGRNPQYIPLKKTSGRDYIGPSFAGFVRCFSDLLLREPGDFALDHLIVWRTYSLQYYNFNNYAPKVHFWSHDFSPNHFDYKVHTIYALSEYHKQKMIDVHGYTHNYVVGCNGTGVDLTQPIPRREHKIVCYASNYSRGLLNLLTIWPYVYKVVPEAQLRIYYSRNNWNTLTDEQLADIVKKIETLKSFGVHEVCPHEMMPHNQLLKEFNTCSILCYPYIGESETHSIVCTSAAQSGVILCVRKKHGLMDTCVAQDDVLPTDEDIKNRLIQLLQMSEDELYPMRIEHREKSKQFTWENAAKSWMTVLS